MYSLRNLTWFTRPFFSTLYWYATFFEWVWHTQPKKNHIQPKKFDLVHQTVFPHERIDEVWGQNDIEGIVASLAGNQDF